MLPAANDERVLADSKVEPTSCSVKRFVSTTDRSPTDSEYGDGGGPTVTTPSEKRWSLSCFTAYFVMCV